MFAGIFGGKYDFRFDIYGNRQRNYVHNVNSIQLYVVFLLHFFDDNRSDVRIGESYCTAITRIDDTIEQLLIFH